MQPSDLKQSVYKSLTSIFSKVPPFETMPENVLEMRFALRLILDKWRNLVTGRVDDKKAYQQEALLAVDPGDEGVRDIRFLTATSLGESLEGAEWGIKRPLSGQHIALKDQPSNRTMSAMQAGVKMMLHELNEALEEDGAGDQEFSDAEESEDEIDELDRLQGGSKVNLVRTAYVPAGGKTSTIAQLEDDEVVLPDSKGKIEQRSIQHPSHQARKDILNQPMASTGPGTTEMTRAPRQHQTTSAGILGLQPFANSFNTIGNMNLLGVPQGSSANAVRSGIKLNAWTTRESLELLRIFRDHEEMTHNEKVAELHRVMTEIRSREGGGQKPERTREAMRQHMRLLHEKGLTMKDLQAKLGIVGDAESDLSSQDEEEDEIEVD